MIKYKKIKCEEPLSLLRNLVNVNMNDILELDPNLDPDPDPEGIIYLVHGTYVRW